MTPKCEGWLKSQPFFIQSYSLKTLKLIKSNSIHSIDGFTVGNNYQLNNGYYRGKIVRLIHISRYKQICINGERHRQVRCLIVESGKIFNSQLNHLSAKIDNQRLKKDLSNISNKNIIKLAKLGNKDARQEFIRRFKKLPKINH